MWILRPTFTVNERNNMSEQVSRAGGKLEGFAREAKIEFRGMTVLDIGSSTGGWTEYALNRGAVRVIAVEKGTRQMRARIAADPRVELHEKTDIFEFEDRSSDIVMADVSFLSLTKVLAYAKKRLAKRGAKFVVMCKPQFEARPEQLVEGIVKNEKMRREIIQGFEAWLKANGFVVLAKRDSTVRGKYGNLERLYYLALEN